MVENYSLRFVGEFRDFWKLSFNYHQSYPPKKNNSVILSPGIFEFCNNFGTAVHQPRQILPTPTHKLTVANPRDRAPKNLKEFGSGSLDQDGDADIKKVRIHKLGSRSPRSLDQETWRARITHRKFEPKSSKRLLLSAETSNVCPLPWSLAQTVC